LERKISDSWEMIAIIEGSGTTTIQQYYSYSDNISALQGISILSYRVKQTDYDGSFEYSNVAEADVKPESFTLFQNCPNSFNPLTTIRYSLAEDCNVILKVYDMLGNEVVSLVNNQQKVGSYEVEFDGSNFSSGIYYYQLNAGSYPEIKKLVLMK